MLEGLSCKQGKTPYQIIKRCFGEFTCFKCQRTLCPMIVGLYHLWTQDRISSVLSHYPHHQHPLKSPGGLAVNDQNKEHLMELCNKCQDLSSYCCRYNRKTRHYQILL